MATDLGYVQYDYCWSQGNYYRRLMCGLPRWEQWVGNWVPCPNGPPD
jgi:hypothetical protein